MPAVSSVLQTSGRPNPARPPRAARPGAALLVAALLATPCAGQGPAVAPAPAAAAADSQPAAERLKLSTSDGVPLAAWYYPVAKPDAGADAPRPAVAILLHDLEKSHKDVEPLAKQLQALGVAVVAPDLRGHGATTGPAGRELAAKSLKRADFEAMAMTGGGRVREQQSVSGDVEAIWSWIREHADAERLDTGKLFLVGAGSGAAVAAAWTANDARWPAIASGPQGGNVRGIVMIGPAWVTRGFSIAQPLAGEPLRRMLPMFVIAGPDDADAIKLYEQMKRARPDSWSEKRLGQTEATEAAKLGKDGLPSLYLRELASPLAGNGLATSASMVEAFVATVTAAPE